MEHQAFRWERISGYVKKQHILIYAHYYELAATGQLLRELAEGLLPQFKVTVIAAVPSYLGTVEDRYKKQKYYFENHNGVDIIRVRVPEFQKGHKISRIKNILVYFLRAIKATGKVEDVDYVMGISQPPILGGMLGVYGKWRHSVRKREKLCPKKFGGSSIYLHKSSAHNSDAEGGITAERTVEDGKSNERKYRSSIYLHKSSAHNSGAEDGMTAKGAVEDGKSNAIKSVYWLRDRNSEQIKAAG